jgi:hypothetical protein
MSLRHSSWRFGLLEALVVLTCTLTRISTDEEMDGVTEGGLHVGVRANAHSAKGLNRLPVDLEIRVIVLHHKSRDTFMEIEPSKAMALKLSSEKILIHISSHGVQVGEGFAS